MPVITCRHEAGKEKELKFDTYPHIKHVELIRSIFSDVLNPIEDQRITAGEMLTKYKTWFDDFICKSAI